MTDEKSRDAQSEMVCVREVEKIYGGKSGIEGFSMTIGKGGIHGILGARRSGKTTLMELLAGCVCADAGSIAIGGRELSVDAVDVKQKIGYVPQNMSVCSDMTVGEFLNFVGQTRKVETNKRYRQIKEALDLTGLETAQNRLMGRLTSYERKKVFLAAALLGNPDVLLLDEPIPVCSAEQRRELEGLVQMLGKIKTVLLATASFETARSLCEDVVILSDGRQLVAGSFEALESKLAKSDEAVSLEDLYRSLVAASNAEVQGSAGKERQA